MVCEWPKVFGDAVGSKGKGVEVPDSEKAWSINLFDAADSKTIGALREQQMACMQKAHGDSVGFGKTSKPKIAANGMPLKAETIKNEETGEPELTGRMKFTLKRKLVQKGGVYNSGPLVIDSNRDDWPHSVLLGNNSIVRVKFHYYSWEFEGAVGLSAEMHAVQVIEHVPYGGGMEINADGFGNVKGGAIAPKEEEALAADECKLDFSQQLAAAASEVEAMDGNIPF